MNINSNLNYTKKDFASDQEVKWCPGCGDYSILASIQTVCAKIGKRKEDICFISGIGCSSRLPYYMSTYGMHTIHGRAIAVASGLKVHNPQLSVWVATGDGDALSIGGNHFIHAIRRNINLTIVIFNNEIYGLTKGQYSPTSKLGLKTKSSPYGTFEKPFSPAALAIGGGATFFARTIDSDPKHMQEVLLRAHQHKGTSIVEVLQNCVIFNDGAHALYSDRQVRDENTIRIEHGKPMIFGQNQDKGIILTGGADPEAKVVPLANGNGNGNGKTEVGELLVHDEHKNSTFLANLLTTFQHPQHPLPIGIFRAVERPAYEESMEKQIAEVSAKKNEKKMRDVLTSGDTWIVE